MPDKLGRPTLAEHLAAEQLAKLVQKKFFTGYQVPAYQFLEVGLWMFGQGGILGRARRDKLEFLAQMFVSHKALQILFSPLGLPTETADNVQWVFEALRKVGSDGLRYYQDSQRKEPELLMDLWLTSFAPPEVDFRDPNKLQELANKKLQLDQALQRLDNWLFSGIGFGANHPALLESIWKRSYETVDKKKWAFARRAGLDISEEFSPILLHEEESRILESVAFYVKKYFPELIDALNMRLS
jgi:hypothetical protein